MKAYEIYTIRYLITYETTGLIPIATTVANADYALYEPSSRDIVIKNIYDFRKKRQINENDKIHQKIQKCVSKYTMCGFVYKTLEAAKQRRNSYLKSDTLKKKYYENGNLFKVYSFSKNITGFEKYFTQNGVLIELFFLKNNKLKGPIFTKVLSVFHHVSFLINKKEKIKVV
jgi:hypothetical protein